MSALEAYSLVALVLGALSGWAIIYNHLDTPHTNQDVASLVFVIALWPVTGAILAGNWVAGEIKDRML